MCADMCCHSMSIVVVRWRLLSFLAVSCRVLSCAVVGCCVCCVVLFVVRCRLLVRVVVCCRVVPSVHVRRRGSFCVGVC